MDYPSFLLIFLLTTTYTLADLTYPDPLQDPDQDYTDNNQDKRTLCAALNKCGGGASRPAYFKRVVYKPQVVHGGYRYTKPKVQFALKPPTTSWKPVSTAIKPVVEVVKPETHLDHVHVHPQPAHVDQVHQITLPHGGHYDTFAHVDHLPIRPFVPSPVLFEVTRPNLGVLPIGAKFLTPVLKEFLRVHHLPAPLPVVPAPIPIPHAPHPHIHAVAPVSLPPHFHVAAPAPLSPHLHVAAQAPLPPHFHASAPAPLPPHLHAHLVPQHPGVSVEYHGTRNYLPVGPAVSAQPLPFEHAHHGFAPQQALPHEHHAHFLQQQQQQHLHAIQQYQDIPQGQLPLEGEENRVIQPGQTDLQIPYHLPQQGNWQLPEDFRPSPQLQTSYHK